MINLALRFLMTAVLLLAPTIADGQDSEMLRGPTIIKPNSSETILQTGDNFTMLCVGNRPLQFKQQELPEENIGEFKMEQKTGKSEEEYWVSLDLYNVDPFAVGYYACFYDTVNTTDVLSDLFEDPNNTAHVAYTYIYVNGPVLFAPMRTFIIAKSDLRYIVECKPTTPDIKVKLTLDFVEVDYELYNPKLGFVLHSYVLTNEFTFFTCVSEKQDIDELREVIVQHMRTEAPRPTIYGGLPYFLKGETFTINCTVNVKRNVPIVLSWSIPGPWEKVSNTSNAYDMADTLYKNITIHEATREDAGNYTCISSSNQAWRNSSSFFKTYLDAPVLKVSKSRQTDPVVDRKRQKITKIVIDIDQVYPPATVSVIKDNVTLFNDGHKYKMYPEEISNPMKFQLTVLNLGAEDTGTYIFKVSNGYLQKNISYYLTVKDRPKVDFGTHEDKKYTLNTVGSLRCDAIGTPLPEIQWIFTDEDGITTVIDKKHQEDENMTAYEIKSNLKLSARISGTVTCNASNEEGSDAATRRFLVNELPDGFGVKNADKLWFPQGNNVTVSCLASKYDFDSVVWYDEYYQELPNVDIYENKFSLVAELKMPSINIGQAGVYICNGTRNNGSDQSQTVTINVAHIQPPMIEGPLEESLDVAQFEKVNMTCVADSVPPPSIKWYKDGAPLEFDDNVQLEYIQMNRTSLNSTVKIYPMQNDYAGTYECRVTSQGLPMQSKFYNLLVKEPLTHLTTYLCVAGAIFFLLILLVVYLTWKIRKEKQFRKELAAAGLLYFKEGVTKSINPDLGIDEQAELLPYDERFEFPAEKLTLGKQLGAGAFGVVYKAEARGIVNAEETTTVAVKMVKKTADNMYIKALASELKIMVHLGKHINIVNLLGACTKNVGKRELIVIVEYCKFGNIHNYLQKHREVFIDQLTNNSEKPMGNVNRGFSCSSGNSGMHSDYFGSNHTQDTLLNTANTNRSSRKASESGYVQPEWRSNYESDYSYDGRSCRPLCSRDLLAWAFQIARGMEYLASRKVLHGDLAARNILLAEDNIVKICDFGLARSIYKNDEYQKKENSPLPVKWLAIECMTDRIFSTQSDVWSFGIVLWELFSLAKTPYPNISPPSLLQWLSEGHRLEKPTYADDKLYDVMKRCWASKPTARPSFTQLQEILGSFLEDNVRNHYVDLNATYMDMNAKQVGEEDYLAMVSAPDYNNLITPSPHHYVNDARNFFPATPTQLQHDEEGYLQMSPASRQSLFTARPQGTKFDFDARVLTSRASEANSCGSESTPMLALNNLPRSGSESDQEGNTSPYMNMCPKIEEETDDVFNVKENNMRNTPLSVTNPQYIALSVEDEKKQHKFANNYVNVNVPNGLVK